MTAPAGLEVDWRAVITAGMADVYGLTVTVTGAAPLTSPCWECDCTDGHLWVTPTQPCPCGGQP